MTKYLEWEYSCSCYLDETSQSPPASPLLTLALSYYCELFVASAKVKPRGIKQIRALLPKHPGGGGVRQSCRAKSATYKLCADNLFANQLPLDLHPSICMYRVFMLLRIPLFVSPLFSHLSASPRVFSPRSQSKQSTLAFPNQEFSLSSAWEPNQEQTGKSHKQTEDYGGAEGQPPDDESGSKCSRRSDVLTFRRSDGFRLECM